MDLIEERSPQEKLIIAKTLIESVLKELPCRKPEMAQNVSDSDLISRKAVIEVLDRTQWLISDAKNVLKDHVRILPSAQPKIVMCKDCKNWDTTWQNDWAKNYHYCPLIDGTRNGDWYCADAERRST